MNRVKKFRDNHGDFFNIRKWNICTSIKFIRHLKRWKEGEDAREPVARFLRTYGIYLQDHLNKEDKFFDEAEKAIEPEEEKEMFEYFQAVMATTKKVDEMIKEIDNLELKNWFTN